MAPQVPRAGHKNSGGGVRGSTKPDASGQVLPVTNPLDLWYLCEKARYAKAKPQYSQPNLASVIEMKFGGDSLSDGQRKDYENIAGDSDNFRLLHTDRCDKADRRLRRDWMTAAQKEPVYKPVSQVMSLPLRASADPHALIVGMIDAEHQAARHALEVKPLPPGTQVMSATPDMREANAQAARARALIELSLIGPFVAVGGAGMGTGIAAAGAGATSGAMLTARAGPRVVHYGRLIDWARVAGWAGAGGATAAYAESEDGSSAPVLSPEQQRQWEAYQEWAASQRYQPRMEQRYLFWPDAPETQR